MSDSNENVFDEHLQEVLNLNSTFQKDQNTSRQLVSQLPLMMSDKVDIQRLKNNNWPTWKWQITNLLESRGLVDVLESKTETRGSPREVAARQIISSSLDQTLLCKVIHCQTAQEIWKCLSGIFENKTSFALTDLIGKMNSFKMVTLEDVENGVSQIQSLACQIKALGGHADDITIESAILRALPKSFSSFVTAWTFLDSERRTLDNLHSHLMRKVALFKTDEGHTKEKALAAMNNHQNQTNKNKNKSFDKSNNGNRSNLSCRYCKKSGHDIKDCRKLAYKRKKEAESKNESKQSATEPNQTRPSTSKESEPESQAKDNTSDSAKMAFGYVANSHNKMQSTDERSMGMFADTVWTADSGASFLMTYHLEWIAHYREFTNKIPIRLGDGHIVEAHGKGLMETNVGILDPVFYVPHLKTIYCRYRILLLRKTAA